MLVAILQRVFLNQFCKGYYRISAPGSGDISMFFLHKNYPNIYVICFENWEFEFFEHHFCNNVFCEKILLMYVWQAAGLVYEGGRTLS